jgi:hypothetical protein
MSSQKKTSGQDNGKPLSKALIHLFNYKDSAWQTLSDKKSFLEFVNPIDGEHNMTPEECEIYTRKLSFYKDAEMISVTNLFPADFPEEEFLFAYLKKGDDYLVPLDGNADYIHEANDQMPINLTQDNVYDYLKFFCNFCALENEDGSYSCIDIIEGPNSEFLEGCSKMISTRVLRDYDGGRLVAEASLSSFVIETRGLINGSVYDLKYKITNTGEVIMLDDKHIGAI